MWVANACIIAQLTDVAFRYTANYYGHCLVGAWVLERDQSQHFVPRVSQCCRPIWAEAWAAQ